MRVLLAVFMAAAVAACDRSSAGRNAAAADSTPTPAPAAPAARTDSMPAATTADSGKSVAADTMASAPAAQPSASKPAAPKAATPKASAAKAVEPTFAASLGINPKELHATPSGLKMIDVKEGSGTEATGGHEVVVHYTGWLTNGKKFDSSRDRGEPFTFNLGAGDVIQGWDQGVAGMKVGGRRKLVIPADLGYGDNGAPPDIPPGATLVFDVELLEVH